MEGMTVRDTKPPAIATHMAVPPPSASRYTPPMTRLLALLALTLLAAGCSPLKTFDAAGAQGRRQRNWRSAASHMGPTRARSSTSTCPKATAARTSR